MEQFLDALNTFLKEERKKVNTKCKSFFVEHKTVVQNSGFKAIKKCEINIYIVKQDKHPVLLFNESQQFNSSHDSQDKVFGNIEKNIMIQFMSLIRTNKWNDIVEGCFEIDSNEN